jgi:uncharacterized protein (DUF1015 family)
VPAFSPFAGIRYDCSVAGAELAALAAPPYDVVDEDQRAALEAADPHNAVRLILPRDVETDGDRYERAAATFARWREQGVLTADPQARFYAYGMHYRGPHGEPRHTRGVIGALALSEPGDSSILPHERTLPKAKSDRLALLRAMRVNLDPIWGLTPAPLTALLDGATPLCSCTDADGVYHELGAIDAADSIRAVEAAVASAPLVLADGHHRFETACNYRDELRRGGLSPRGAGAIMTFVVELSDDELCIQPIHRLLDLPAGVDVRARLADAFTITDGGPVTPEGVEALEHRMTVDDAIGIVDTHGLALAHPTPAVRDAALAAVDPVVAGTDAALVEHVAVPRLPEAQWTYRHDAAAVAALVDKGTASAALLLRPVTVAQTRAAALAGQRMPQKTTFFYPKPRTGMVFRALDR